MDIYNTVWLSDYESVKSFGSQSGISSLNQSKIESFVDNVYHSSPKMFADDFLQQSGWCRTCSRKCSPKIYLHRTLSLPELDFSTLRPTDLQERFSQLQLEQENNELRLLVDQLQNALETIEQSMKLDINGQPNKLYFQNTLNNLNLQKKPNAMHDISPHTNTDADHSIDSLDEMYSKAFSDTRKDSKDRNESGYNSTFQPDSSSGKIQDNKDYVRKKDRYSDYSDGTCSDSEGEFYESRLSKKQRFDIDDTSCCVIH